MTHIHPGGTSRRQQLNACGVQTLRGALCSALRPPSGRASTAQGRNPRNASQPKYVRELQLGPRAPHTQDPRMSLCMWGGTGALCPVRYTQSMQSKSTHSNAYGGASGTVSNRSGLSRAETCCTRTGRRFPPYIICLEQDGRVCVVRGRGRSSARAIDARASNERPTDARSTRAIRP